MSEEEKTAYMLIQASMRILPDIRKSIEDLEAQFANVESSVTAARELLEGKRKVSKVS